MFVIKGKRKIIMFNTIVTKSSLLLNQICAKQQSKKLLLSLSSRNVNDHVSRRQISTTCISPLPLSNVHQRQMWIINNTQNPFTYHRSIARLSTTKSSSSSSESKSNSIFGQDLIIDGQTIHYEIAGHGPHVLLLMPGALGTGKTDFMPQLASFDPDIFTIIAWDPPGYGQSCPPEKDFENFYRNDAEMAARLMEILHYRRYSVLGWSDGGITAMILAANDGADCMQKLIIWGSNAYVGEVDREALRKIRNPATDWSPSYRRIFIDIYGQEPFYRLWSRWVAYYMRLNDICREDAKRISCPVLILHGDLDPMVAPEHPVYLVNNIPNATLFRFPKGKHNIHQRYASEFNKLCEDFLTSK